MHWLRFWSSHIMLILLAEIDSVLGYYLVRSCVFVGVTLRRDVPIHLENPTVPVLKFPIFYEARSVIACVKRAQHWLVN
jgi:hypothetical protein